MKLTWNRMLSGGLGTTLALLATVALLRFTDHPWLLPSLGGSCVILFGMPRGAMAQPRSFLGGHALATLTGLAFHSLHAALGAALALMMATRTIHSPAGANPLVVLAEDANWSFLAAPLLPGLVLLFAVAFAINNLPRPWGAGPWPRFFARR
jgi:CBS-domain-containing membrane protein